VITAAQGKPGCQALFVEIHEVRQVSNKNNVTCSENLMGRFIMPLRQAFSLLDDVQLQHGAL